jgi:hypothetical protein
MAFTINGTTGIDLGTQPLTGSLPDANAPSGSVIQVVSDNGNKGTVITSSTSYTDLGYSVTITPVSSSNKLLVMWSAFVYTQQNKTGFIALHDSSNNLVGGYYTQWAGSSGIDQHLHGAYISGALGSTSSVTLKLRGKSDGTGDTTFNAGRYGSFIVMEIAA